MRGVRVCVCAVCVAEEAYWFNSKTAEARWNTPPSCAWSRLDVQGQPIRYVNSVTGQETHTIPAVGGMGGEGDERTERTVARKDKGHSQGLLEAHVESDASVLIHPSGVPALSPCVLCPIGGCVAGSGLGQGPHGGPGDVLQLQDQRLGGETSWLCQRIALGTPCPATWVLLR